MQCDEINKDYKPEAAGLERGFLVRDILKYV